MTAPLFANYSRPPHDLAVMPNWLCWRLIHKPGLKKPRKVPYYVDGSPRHGSQGTDDDRARLVTYDEAVAIMARDGYNGVGFAPMPDSNIVALDFDDCVAEDGTIAQHVEDLCAGTYTEFSPSGTGVRAFFRGTLMSRKDVEAEKGPFPIEVFGHNGFVTFTGRVTDTCALFGFDNDMAWLTPAVIEEYTRRGWDATMSVDSTPDNALAMLEPTLELTDGQIAEYLSKLNPGMGYQDWLHVGMAVHHETKGSESGFQLWNRWSQGASNYDSESGCREKWVSFGKYHGGRITTFKSVIKQANEAAAREAFTVRDEFIARVRECDNEYLLRMNICPEISKDVRLDDLARESLAGILKAKLKGLGTAITLPQARKLVAAPRAMRNQEDGGAPEWLDGWVYVTDDDKFYHSRTERRTSKQSFDAMFNRHMPRVGGVGTAVVKSASAAATDDYQLKTVARMMYLPWANAEGDGTFELDGIDYVNTFRKASVPSAVDQLSDAGEQAVQVLLRHLGLLCSGRQPVIDFVLDWMAFCVQNPGQKIRHAILIKGIEGDGKSLLGKVMQACMGQANVKIISSKVLGTDFSDWAHGACVGVIEEIRMVGHNRYDIYDGIKPNITNDVIAVHPKGKAERNVLNTMNYMAFTNHNDALPISDTDRRWTCIFSSWSNREQMEAALAELAGSSRQYWDELHEAIESQRGELRRYFLDRKIGAGFVANGNALDTDEKDAMRRMTASPEEELVRDIIEQGGLGIGRSVLSVPCLRDAALLADADVSLNSVVINRILNKLGWVKHKRVKWKGAPHSVWTRGQVHSSIQDALDATCEVHSSSAANAGDAFSSGAAGFAHVEDLFG